MLKLAIVLLSVCALSCEARMRYRLSAGVGFGREEEFVKEFSCGEYPFGFYADVSNACDLFHVCEPVYDDLGNYLTTAQYTFACGTSTVFSQRDLACQHYRTASPCTEAESLYESSNVGSGVYTKRGREQDVSLEEEVAAAPVREARLRARLDEDELEDVVEELEDVVEELEDDFDYN